MKKLQKIQKEIEKINAEIAAISIEIKDTSYRRSGGYYGTDKADTTGLVIVKTIERTKYLNTYICLNPEYKHLADKYNGLVSMQTNEYKRLNKLAQNKWAKESIQKAQEMAERDIANGTIFTNYGKRFIMGNKNIYYAHPEYRHSDYNKAQVMPNTPKHWAVAEQLNAIINSAINNIHSHSGVIS